MKSLADGLPPDIARQIHPDWHKNEAAYWAVRDQLLSQYQDQWIAFADGTVIAACKTSLEVLHTPEAMQRHPFVICVGREDQPYRVRRATFAYDPTYPGQALPLLSAEFRSVSGSAGLLLDRVIPDTGADVSVLPWSDCQQLHLDPACRRRRRDEWGRGRWSDDHWLPGLGLAGWSGVPLPTSSGLHGSRAHPGSGCAEPHGRAVPWSPR